MATPGIRIRDPNTGNIILEYTDQLCQKRGAIELGGSGNQTFTIPSFPGNAYWYFVIATNPTGTGVLYSFNEITRTASWVGPGAGNPPMGIIYYGTF